MLEIVCGILFLLILGMIMCNRDESFSIEDNKIAKNVLENLDDAYIDEVDDEYIKNNISNVWMMRLATGPVEHNYSFGSLS